MIRWLLQLSRRYKEGTRCSSILDFRTVLLVLHLGCYVWTEPLVSVRTQSPLKTQVPNSYILEERVIYLISTALSWGGHITSCETSYYCHASLLDSERSLHKGRSSSRSPSDCIRAPEDEPLFRQWLRPTRIWERRRGLHLQPPHPRRLGA